MNCGHLFNGVKLRGEKVYYLINEIDYRENGVVLCGEKVYYRINEIDYRGETDLNI